MTAARATSGTIAADAGSTCPTQGNPTPATHCAGYDTSLLAGDQILRTGDRANVRFDFAFDGADTGVMLRSTLPLVGGLAAATWPAPLPAACASGSTVTDSGRTLNCRIADPLGAGDGSITATFLLSGAAPDGHTLTVHGEISSSTSAVVGSSTDATFTVSSAPFYDLRKDLTPNTLPGPSAYNAPDGTPGFAIPTATGVQVSKAGGWSPLAGPVTWTETMVATATGPAVDVSGFRLLNWGNYGQGCSSQSTASTPANPGYTSFAVSISNQLGPAVNGQYACSQPGGPGTPVTVSWLNPAALGGGLHAHAWVMLWVPATAAPPGTSAVSLRASGFDPNDVNGVSNYFGNAEPTTNNNRNSANIINQDNRAFNKYPTSDANPVGQAQPGGISVVSRASTFQSVMRFSNIGTVSQTPVQICDAFDSTVQKLTAYPTNPNFPDGSYAVAVTQGPVGDPILAPPYHPGVSYNNTNNFTVDPGAYTVEFAAGDFDIGPPTNTPQSGASMGASGTAAGCADGGTATGWHTDPNDPAIVAYAESLGLSDPFDVINRVRVTLTGGPVQPGSYVGVKVRFTVRSTFRDATTQAGETILATTRIGDVGAFNYPQSTVAAWTSTALAGPTVAGRIGVDTNVGKSANPTGVQAGAPGENRTTYTITSNIAFGEDVATTQPMRIVDHLPTGMRYVTGSASRAPDHVLVQPDRSTIIVWDLGNISGPTNGVTTNAPITFQGEADPLAPTPSTNHNVVISESIAPDGTALDTDPPGCGGLLPFDVPPTPTVPVATVVNVPAPAGYSGCFGQGGARRMGWAQVTIGNVFLKLGAAKTSLSTQIEPNSSDGVAGAEVGWDLTVTNSTSNSLDGIDIVDVLPFDGDGRSPASSFSGTLSLTGVTTADPPSVAPNALPTLATGPFPPRAGTTIYVTSAAPASIAEDPYAPSNLAGGTTSWCLLADLGDPGCPATIAGSTALRIISGPLASQATRSARIGVATSGNADDDVYTNEAWAQAIGLSTLVPVAADSMLVVASQIAGTVWNDADADGVIDGGESGIAGVDVQITGTGSDGNPVDETVSTDASGNYVLADLRSGTYTVTVDQVSVRAINPGYAITFDPEHELTDPTGAFAVDLGVNTTLNGRNVGFATQSLSGVVYDDLDNDGTQDVGETGNAGVDVTITGTDDLGAVSRTTTTLADGTFTFADLRPGNYGLEKQQLPTTVPGKSTPGTAGGTAAENEITDITLGTAAQATGYLFGELPPEIISGVVFVDADGDGARDAGELGIADVTVDLSGTDDLGPVSLSAQTQADGTFTFAGLRPGTYTLTETQPAAYLQGTTSTNGSVGTVNGDVISGIEPDGPNAMGYTFAELPGSSISGVVFEDLDADGARDAGEPAIAGVSVELSGVDSDANPITPVTAVTDADGAYAFGGLRPGTYVLTETDPAGHLDGRETAGSVGGTVANAAPGSNTISAIALGVGVDAVGYAFADVQPTSVAGSVFVDADNDGVRDAGEIGIGGVDIDVAGTDDFGQAVTETATTVVDGTYTVSDLRPGTYSLTETQPPAYIDGTDSAGTAGGTAGNDVVTGILLASGTEATGYLFGELAQQAVSGVVFADADGDGTQDAGDAGIVDVTVALTGTDDLGATVSLSVDTEADGTFEFTNLRPGTYTLTETQPTTHLQGITSTNSAVGSVTGDVISAIVVNGSNITTGYAFAELAPASVSGIVFDDLDADGTRDVGESGIAAATVALAGIDDGGNTVGPVPTTTGADGTYRFDGLRPGMYVVTETDPAGYLDGRETVGSDGGAVDNTVPGSNTISEIDLGIGVDATGYLFADVRAASLAGAVFIDIDDDGVQDPGENGISGVDIDIAGTDDFGQAVTEAATTAADGTYTVSDLRPGTYSITESQPPAYADATDTAGTAGGVVANDVVTGIVLGSGTTATGYVFAEREVSISGAVFSDLDADGTLDVGEPGIAGVTIELLDGGGDTVDTTLTIADGSWEFGGLVRGTYGVHEIQPASGYANGATIAGTANGTVGTDEVTGITLDDDASGYLFAEIALSAIQGTVWNDANDDGVVDAGEAPIPGVEITLGGDASATTATGLDGTFMFAGLEPGEYTLTETQPDGWVDGRMVIGSGGGTASAVNTISGITIAPGDLAGGYGFGERTAGLQIIARTQAQTVPVPTGPNVLVGKPVRWTYEVVNDGDAPLTDLVVEDDQIGDIACPATDVAPHSSITCEATGTAAAGQYVNHATAHATVAPSSGTPSTPTDLEATDTSHYFGMVVSADISASVNGADATTAPGPQLPPGSTAMVVITLTNTGNVPLDIDSIDAGALGTLDCAPAGPVAPGDSVECTTTSTPAPGAYDYPVTADLAGPAGVSIDGAPTPSTLTVGTETFFTVAEAAPGDPDTDDDGLLDEEEINRYGTDPNVPNAKSYGLSKYIPLQPARVLDTRNGVAWDGGMPGAGTTIDLPVLGQGGVPHDAQIKAVVLNVTATDAAAWGFVTAYPSGIGQPNVSNVNVDQVGESVANLVTVPVGPDGSVRLYTSSATHLLADVAGYYVASADTSDGRLNPVTPSRLLDTRSAQVGYSGAKPVAGDTLSLQVAGRGGVPATGASAVVLTVTVADSDGWGYVTAYPGGTARPDASNVNVFRVGQTIANQVIVPIGADGMVQLYTSAGLHLVADVTGWFTDPTAEASFSGLFVPVEPVRKLDTRAAGQKTSADGTVTVFTLPGTIPGVAAAAAAVNVTATETDGPGYITAFPAGVDMPYTSVLNVEGGDETIAGHVVAPVTAGDLTLYSYAGAHLVADVVGWYRE